MKLPVLIGPEVTTTNPERETSPRAGLGLKNRLLAPISNRPLLPPPPPPPPPPAPFAAVSRARCPSAPESTWVEPQANSETASIDAMRLVFMVDRENPMLPRRGTLFCSQSDMARNPPDFKPLALACGDVIPPALRG